MLFTSIPGLDDVKETLLGLAKNNRLAHAYQIAGEPSHAGLALVLALITYKNCSQPLEKSGCGQCPSCVRIGKFIHPDIHFFFPTPSSGASTESQKEELKATYRKLWVNFVCQHPYGTWHTWAQFLNQQGKDVMANIAQKSLAIGRQQAKDVLQSCSMKPFVAQDKYIIIWLAEAMNESATNTLLKTIEDPPPHTYFFLITHATEKLLPTLHSRTHRIPVGLFTQEEVKNYLCSQGHEEEKAAKTAFWSGGNIADAWEHLEQLQHPEQPSVASFIQNWWRSCWLNSYDKVIDSMQKFDRLDKTERNRFLYFSLQMLQKIYWQQHHPNHSTHTALESVQAHEEMVFVKNFAKTVNQQIIEGMYTILNDMGYHMERNIEGRMVFMKASLAIMQEFKKAKPNI